MISIGIHKFSNVLGFHPRNISGYIADFNAKYTNSIMTDTGGVIEWNNTAQLTPTEFNGLKASSLDGSTQYWQIALPNNIASGTANDWVSAGSKPAGWSETGTIVWNVTSETGTTSTYSVSLYRSGGPSTEITIPGLTVGKKYKLRLRYKGTYCYVSYGGAPTTFLSTSEWNVTTIIFTAVGTSFYLGGISGTCYVDYLSIKEDQGFDLNKDQEQILHSKNWDFERTLGTELIGTLNFNSGWAGTNTTYPSNTSFTNSVNGYGPYRALLTIGQKYILNIAGSTTDASGLKIVNATGGTTPLILDLPTGTFSKEVEFLAVDTTLYLRNTSTGTTTITSFAVKPIPNLVSNGTFDSLGSWTVGGSGTVAVSGGQITLTSTGGPCFIRLNPFVPILGKKYRFSLQIISRTGAFDTETKIYGYSSGTVLSSHLAVGVNIIDIPYTTDLGGVQFRLGTGLAAGVGDTLVVDNIHIYEIPEWTATGNHTQNLSILDKSGATGQSMLISASGAGDSTTNYVSLPSANIESCVAGKKYTLEGFARLDASSLTYGSDLFSSVVNGTTNPMENFSTTGNSFSASSAGVSNYQGCSINIPFSSGEIVKVTFTVGTKTGANITVATAINASGAGAIGSTGIITGTGNYTFYYRVTSDSSDYIQFNTPQTGAYNIAVTDIVITKATPITLTARIGSKSVTSSALSIVAGTFTKFVLNFEATEDEVNQDLKLWLSGAGSVYVDKLSLTQAYDVALIPNIKTNSIATRQQIFFRHSGTIYGWNLEITSAGRIMALHGGSGASEGYGQLTTSNSITTAWNSIINVRDRTGNQTIYINGVSAASGSIAIYGKITDASIGFSIGDGFGFRFNGLIGNSQIIRFTNISQSNFNPETYKIGQSVTGGGAEVVLYHDWSNVLAGVSYDKSLIGNNLTASGSAGNDIITIKDYNQTLKLRQATKANRPAFTSNEVVFTSANSDNLVNSATLGNCKTIFVKAKVTDLSGIETIIDFGSIKSLYVSFSNLRGSNVTYEAYDLSLNALPEGGTGSDSRAISANTYFIAVIKQSTAIDCSAITVSSSVTALSGSVQNLAFFSTELSDADVLKVLNYMR